jgi:hypothetical protein
MPFDHSSRDISKLCKILLVFRLSCGTTWHAAGLLGNSRGLRAHTKIAIYSNELYTRLEEETGLGTGEREGGGRERNQFVLATCLP